MLHKDDRENLWKKKESDENTKELFGKTKYIIQQNIIT